MKKTKVEDLPSPHQFVWNTLTLLEDGERIRGVDLMARTAIDDRRQLYYVINDLRSHGFLVGSSKSGDNGGYFEIRDRRDLDRTTTDLRKAAAALFKTAQQLEEEFYVNIYNTMALDDDDMEGENVDEEGPEPGNS